MGTQSELVRLLKKAGIEVTQATVSRDVNELKIIKVPLSDGSHKYSMPYEKQANKAEVMARLKARFRELVTHVDHGENLIVIRTLPGSAQGLGATLDELEWSEIVGTVAGDDTILVVLRSRKVLRKVFKEFKNLQKQK